MSSRGMVEGAIVLCLIFWVMTLAGCVHDASKPPAPAPVVVVSGCEFFHRLTASPKDTDETKREVLAFDRTYDQVCGKPK